MENSELEVFAALDEQASVSFTGRINVLHKTTKQHLGHLFMIEGHVVNCYYKGHQEMKAFHALVVDNFILAPLHFIVEPELIDLKEKRIHFPYSVLKRKSCEILAESVESQKHRPPSHLKLLPLGDFIESKTIITPEEYDVLSVMTEWSKVDEIYQNCPLLEHQITNALVSLRQKKAIKVMGVDTPKA